MLSDGFTALPTAGADGLVDTAEDGAIETVINPGPDGSLGTAEQWIKEGNQGAQWTRLSCHRFRANEVRMQLSVLAYNLGNLWRRLALAQQIKHWSLTSLQQRLV